MDQVMVRGKYVARISSDAKDIVAAQRLRFRAFLRDQNAGDCGASGDALDVDAFDDICKHVLVEEKTTGKLVCVFRFLPLADGREIAKSYSARYYDLSSLQSFAGSMVEMGRFCTDPDVNDPSVLRVAWAAMTRYVDDQGIDLLFGCSSFDGTDANVYREAFEILAQKHIAPKRWLPRIKAPRVFEFASRLAGGVPDRKVAMRKMPPLLRTYLAMGGWVSDHAVVDPEMGTLHVFTGVEISRVPHARASRLRMVAARG